MKEHRGSHSEVPGNDQGEDSAPLNVAAEARQVVQSTQSALWSAGRNGTLRR